jgi:hypothetical protein
MAAGIASSTPGRVGGSTATGPGVEPGAEVPAAEVPGAGGADVTGAGELAGGGAPPHAATTPNAKTNAADTRPDKSHPFPGGVTAATEDKAAGKAIDSRTLDFRGAHQ